MPAPGCACNPPRLSSTCLDPVCTSCGKQISPIRLLVLIARNQQQNPPARDDECTAKEAASILGYTVETVRRKASQLGGWRLPSDGPCGHWRFSRADLHGLKQQANAPSPPAKLSSRRRKPTDSADLLPIKGKAA